MNPFRTSFLITLTGGMALRGLPRDPGRPANLAPTPNPGNRNPRQMGAKAFRDGVLWTANPFSLHTGQGRRWAAGYMDARRKATTSR